MLIDFSTLKLNDSSPVYQQIIKFVKIKIALGEAEPGDELPSRRMLSVILNVNPNTIQKCCRIMENEGFLLSQAGAKSVLNFDAEAAEQMKQTLYLEEGGRFIAEMKRLKLRKDQALEIITSCWEQGENDDEKK
jgi:DNA-binding transcriptional regulator YhcF (GntR family)